MFWTVAPIILIFITIIVCIVLYIKKQKVEYVLYGTMVLLIVLFAALIFGDSVSPDVTPYAIADKDNPIYLHSLGNSNDLNGDIKGTFFLGTGSISSDIEQFNTYHYFYYLNGKDGGIASETIDQKKAIIFEDTETEPYFLKYKIECPANREQGFFIIDTCKESLKTATYQYELEFHIPAGSIDYSYSIQP